jgi:hypothetical protein
LGTQDAYIFDIWAWVDSDNITVLDSEVMSDNAVHSRASIIQIIISQDNQNSILSLLALDKDSVATEKTQSLHCVVGEGNDGVVIINGIGDPVATQISLWSMQAPCGGKLTSKSLASSSSSGWRLPYHRPVNCQFRCKLFGWRLSYRLVLSTRGIAGKLLV